MLIDAPLREVLSAFAAAAPTPAGGSASALASAVGVSLLMMGARLPRARLDASDRVVLGDAITALGLLQQHLADAIDTDASAYARVLSARDAERQEAIRAATDVPLLVMHWSLAALILGPTVASRCRRIALSDVHVGIELVVAGFAGARSSALDNLRMMPEATSADQLRADVRHLADRAAAAAAAAREASAGR